MKRARIPQTLLLALLAFAAVGAALGAEPRGEAAPAAVSGVYSVTFEVNAAYPVPESAIITCRARIAPSLPSLDGMNRGVAPVESATGVAAVSGATAKCLVEIPYAWRVADARGGVALSYEVVESGGGMGPARSRQGTSVVYPEAGGSARVRFNVTF